MREVDAFVLTLQETNAPGLIPAITKASSASAGPGKISAINADMDTLRRGLENSLGKPVVDETNLKGKFDIELKWKAERDKPRSEALIEAVREQLGLQLAPVKRRIEVLIVIRGNRKQGESQRNLIRGPEERTTRRDNWNQKQELARMNIPITQCQRCDPAI